MDNLQVRIKRWYTDMNGVIIDKSLVPAAIQVKVPVYLFNEIDKQGAFRNGRQIKPVFGGLFYLYSYVNGLGYNFLDFQVGNNIKQQFFNGDLILVFGDDPTLPNFLCMVQISASDQSYHSVLTNMKDKTFDVAKISYFSDNKNNWSEPLTFIEQDNLAISKFDNISPLAYTDPYLYLNQDFLEITYPVKLTDKKGIAFYMLFDTNDISFQLDFNTISSQFNSVNNGNDSKAVLFRVN